MKVNIKSDCRGWRVGRVIDQIFEDRGIDDPEHFLNPRPEDMLPLTDLKNIEEAAQIVLANVEAKKLIGLYADCDLDGITSATIIYRYLKKISPDVNIKTFINHGKSHGLQQYNIDGCKKCDILIVVDSLDSNAFNYEEVQKNSNVTDVVVLDHHTVNPKIPYNKWITLVSSQVDYGNPELSGAGVCMKFVLYLDRVLGVHYAEDLYDLAASGLIGDMVDMTSPENRYIASRGLEEIHNPAIQKLAGGFDWDAKSIAFSLAPATNSCMRLDKNEYALKAFLADDNNEVLKNVRVLKKCKEDQNKEIDEIMPDVMEQCNKQLDKKMLIIFIQTEGSVAGLLGNRLLEKYKRPIVIIQKNDEDDYYRGSMRAVGVDDFQAMINESGLGRAFGHALASGVEIHKKNLQAFINYMERKLPDVGAFEESIDADIWVDAVNIDRYYIEQIQRLNKISGTGFLPIKVYLNDITEYEISSMSNGKHLVINIADTDLTLIQWNFDGDWNVFRDASLFCDELECVIELQANWIGKRFMLMGIIQWINIKEG